MFKKISASKFFTSQRMVSLSLMIIMIGLISLIGILPINGIRADNGQEKSDSKIAYELKIDKNSPFLFILPDRAKKQIVIGESKYQEQIKIESEKKKIPVRQLGKRVVIARSEPANRYGQDRPYGDKIALAKQAASSVGMDWKILAAVWQIESGMSWDTGRRSYAGATGPWQFMPGTWRGYAIDANGDGQASISSAEDGAYAAAKLLSANGASAGNIDRALLAYNHSIAYVNKVKQIASGIVD